MEDELKELFAEIDLENLLPEPTEAEMESFRKRLGRKMEIFREEFRINQIEARRYASKLILD